jgi:hypothetical protein
MVVTSTDFTHTANPAGIPIVVLLDSDTVSIDPAAGHDETYPIAPANGFFVRLINPDTLSATVTMKVWVDGDRMYSRENWTLIDSSIEWSRKYSSIY